MAYSMALTANYLKPFCLHPRVQYVHSPIYIRLTGSPCSYTLGILSNYSLLPFLFDFLHGLIVSFTALTE